MATVLGTRKRRATNPPGAAQPATRTRSASVGSAKKRTYTYGVELEYVYAFEEGVIEFEPDENDGAKEFCKHLPKTLRDQSQFNLINIVHNPDRGYNSWGVKDTVDEEIQPYEDEPQRALALFLMSILQNEQGERTIGFASRRLPDRYTRREPRSQIVNWSVHPAPTVSGIGSQYIQDVVDQVFTIETWDSYGVQLVSPIFNSDDREGQDQIKNILDTIKYHNGDPARRHNLFVTNQCAMQVHVQRPQEVAGLKALASLLWFYEEEIARMHPPCRHPRHPNAAHQFESNRLALVLPENELGTPSDRTTAAFDLSRHGLDKVTTCPEISRLMRNYTTWPEVARIFNWPHADPADLGTNVTSVFLEKSIGNRNRQVNFIHAAWLELKDAEGTKAKLVAVGKLLPETIEFRQARGTLEADDVEAWVEFCVGLVRLADDIADGKKTLPYICSDEMLKEERINVFDLFYLLELSPARITYWTERMAGWMIYRNNDESDRTGAPNTSVPHPNEYRGPESPVPASSQDPADGAPDPSQSLPGGSSTDKRKASDTLDESDPKKPKTSHTQADPKDAFSKFNGTAASTFSTTTEPSSEPAPKEASKTTTTPSTVKTSTTPKEPVIMEPVIPAPAEQQAAAEPAPVVPREEYVHNHAEHQRQMDNWWILLAGQGPGRIIPAPVMAPDDMEFDDFSWFVRGFQPDGWKTEKTSAICDGRRNQCGLTAMIQSFQAQYPESDYAALSQRTLGRALDAVRRRNWHADRATSRGRPFDATLVRDLAVNDTEMDQILNDLTQGEYSIVNVVITPWSRPQDAVTTPSASDVARRVGALFLNTEQMRRGRNLYVAYKGPQASADVGHWQSMRETDVSSIAVATTSKAASTKFTSLKSGTGEKGPGKNGKSSAPATMDTTFKHPDKFNQRSLDAFIKRANGIFRPNTLCGAPWLAQTDMTFDGNNWIDSTYVAADWQSESTNATISIANEPDRTNASGLTAIIQALRTQAPGQYTQSTAASLVLILDGIRTTRATAAGRGPPAPRLDMAISATELDQVLNKMTNGAFSIVVVSDVVRDEAQIDSIVIPTADRKAHRVGNEKSPTQQLRRGWNLYLLSKLSFKTGNTHWQSMRRV